MTIDSSYSLNAKKADGGLSYRFSFESIGSTGIEVYSIIDGARVQLTQFVDYNVTLDQYRNPIYRAGVVTLNAALPAGAELSIERKTPITNDYLAEALLPFQSEQFEYQIDKFTFILQELEAHACDCRGE